MPQKGHWTPEGAPSQGTKQLIFLEILGTTTVVSGFKIVESTPALFNLDFISYQFFIQVSFSPEFIVSLSLLFLWLFFFLILHQYLLIWSYLCPWLMSMFQEHCGIGCKKPIDLEMKGFDTGVQGMFWLGHMSSTSITVANQETIHWIILISLEKMQLCEIKEFSHAFHLNCPSCQMLIFKSWPP
jgi:hypothetical protein